VCPPPAPNVGLSRTGLHVEGLAVGRILLTKTFLDRAYAAFMRLCLSAIERDVLQPSQA
jgi:hypothetical protein